MFISTEAPRRAKVLVWVSRLAARVTRGSRTLAIAGDHSAAYVVVQRPVAEAGTAEATSLVRESVDRDESDDVVVVGGASVAVVADGEAVAVENGHTAGDVDTADTRLLDDAAVEVGEADVGETCGDRLGEDMEPAIGADDAEEFDPDVTEVKVLAAGTGDVVIDGGKPVHEGTGEAVDHMD